MIKLETSKMTKAIERAKAVHPKVTVISAADRTYSVTSSRNDGHSYIVKFVVANGHRLAECSCKAGSKGQLCFHVCAAAAVNIGIQSMRRQATKPVASPAPTITRSIEFDHTGVKVVAVRCNGWLI